MGQTFESLAVNGDFFATAAHSQGSAAAGFGDVARATIEELHPGNVAFVLLEDGMVADEHYASIVGPWIRTRSSRSRERFPVARRRTRGLHRFARPICSYIKHLRLCVHTARSLLGSWRGT